jgi:hypothetical protein
MTSRIHIPIRKEKTFPMFSSFGASKYELPVFLRAYEYNTNSVHSLIFSHNSRNSPI